MTTLREQQESVNQCLNKCAATATSLLSEFESLKERCNDLEMRVGVAFHSEG